MNLSNYQAMDPHLLVGLINTELRNHAADLSDLCKTHHLQETLLKERLLLGGYQWMPEQGQFR